MISSEMSSDLTEMPTSESQSFRELNVIKERRECSFKYSYLAKVWNDILTKEHIKK